MCLVMFFGVPYYPLQDAPLPLSAFLPMLLLHNGIGVSTSALSDLSLLSSESVRNVFGGWWFPLALPLSVFWGCKILTFHLLLK